MIAAKQLCIAGCNCVERRFIHNENLLFNHFPVYIVLVCWQIKLSVQKKLD